MGVRGGCGVLGVPVNVGVERCCADAEFGGGALDAEGDLTAIGYDYGCYGCDAWIWGLRGGCGCGKEGPRCRAERQTPVGVLDGSHGVLYMVMLVTFGGRLSRSIQRRASFTSLAEELVSSFLVERARDLGGRNVDGVVRPEVKDNWRSAVDSRPQATECCAEPSFSKAPAPSHLQGDNITQTWLAIVMRQISAVENRKEWCKLNLTDAYIAVPTDEYLV